LVAALLLITDHPVYYPGPYADYHQVIDERIQNRAHIQQVQKQCDNLLLQYTFYSRKNRKYLETTSWDLPGGWVDPTSIENSRRQFMKIAILLRDDIDRVQRSSRPRVAECKAAYDRAMYSHQQLLRPMLYNGQ
jgi:hypothetical protein